MARVCAEPGCALIATDRTHCRQHQRQYDQRRGNRHARGYTSKWAKAAKAFLRAHPFCAICEKAGRRTPATCVDHIQPHGGSQRLFWDRRNWQGLDHACHNAKTRAEQAGVPIKGCQQSGEPLDQTHPWRRETPGGGLSGSVDLVKGPQGRGRTHKPSRNIREINRPPPAAESEELN